MESSHYKLISLKKRGTSDFTIHICNTKRTEGFAEVLIKKFFHKHFPSSTSLSTAV